MIGAERCCTVLAGTEWQSAGLRASAHTRVGRAPMQALGRAQLLCGAAPRQPGRKQPPKQHPHLDEAGHRARDDEEGVGAPADGGKRRHRRQHAQLLQLLADLQVHRLRAARGRGRAQAARGPVSRSPRAAAPGTAPASSSFQGRRRARAPPGRSAAPPPPPPPAPAPAPPAAVPLLPPPAGRWGWPRGAAPPHRPPHSALPGLACC